ncbi:MAG: hypothetical protein HYZ00_07900, partial [Candidatus Hydrogenedentes bacterium]|nr:hypothetical protein [Candidatus Hydrogenedentota bacterium]
AGMLAIDLRCPRKMSIQVEYKSTNPNFDSFSHVHPIEALEGMKDARVRVFLPIFQFYNMTDISFDSLLFRKEDVGNIEGIYRVTDISSVPLLMSVNLAENWRQLNLYQRRVRHLRPALVRGAEAEAGNLIVNGSFEEWMEGAAVPQAFLLPATSAAFSEPEPAYTSDGDRAAWLVWTGPVRQGSGAVNFHTEVHQVQPNTTYEFFVDEANFSNASPRMYAWQVKTEGQKTTYTQLDLNINFKPGIRAYEQYADEFTTFSPEYGDTILIAAVLPGKSEFPVSILLDNLRLVPQE